MFWDIPEYTGHEEEDATHAMRPDGKIVLGKKKEIYVLEMSVPWLDNRNAKFDEKESKYVDIVQGLKVNHPGCKVKQLTFIMDSLGGYSKELVESLKCLDFKVKEIDVILYGMQKIVLTEAVNMIRQFKMRTQR